MMRASDTWSPSTAMTCPCRQKHRARSVISSTCVVSSWTAWPRSRKWLGVTQTRKAGCNGCKQGVRFLVKLIGTSRIDNQKRPDLRFPWTRCGNDTEEREMASKPRANSHHRRVNASGWIEIATTAVPGGRNPRTSERREWKHLVPGTASRRKFAFNSALWSGSSLFDTATTE